MKKHNKKAGPIRLNGYARMSTNLQTETTIAAQTERLEQYCKYMGHELVQVYKDESLSGKSMHNRPGVQQAIASCLAGEADGIAVAYMDRLSRNTKEFLELVELFESAGKHLVFLDLNVDTSTATGKCVVTVLMAMAQMQRESASERSIAGRAHLKRSGKNYSGLPPYGYKCIPAADGTKDLVPVPGEQQILAEIQELLAAGRNGSQITTILNHKGLKSRAGTPWDRKTLYTIIKRITSEQ